MLHRAMEKVIPFLQLVYRFPRCEKRPFPERTGKGLKGRMENKWTGGNMPG